MIDLAIWRKELSFWKKPTVQEFFDQNIIATLSKDSARLFHDINQLFNARNKIEAAISLHLKKVTDRSKKAEA